MPSQPHRRTVFSVLTTLRQPRYAALSVLMLVVAAVCVLAGTWQIARLGQKIGANDDLRSNAHREPVPVQSVLPMTSAPRPSAHAVQFRRVTATGTYDVAHQSLVRHQTVNGTTGYLVVTPLRTAQGALLVVRGFVPDNGVTPTPQPPPSGPVSVTARVEPGDTGNDHAAALRGGQVESINPGQQAARLGAPTFAGYAELLSGQPGVGALTPIPDPDLSNPAGGAVEPQHIAYIIQWYLFALLALAAPIAMARSETRHREQHEFDEVAAARAGAATTPRPEPTAEDVRAAKLADRYGRTVR